MKKSKTALEPARKRPRKPIPKKSQKKKKYFEDVFLFRGIKRVLLGKTRQQSLDLLDRWILKKRVLSLFY